MENKFSLFDNLIEKSGVQLQPGDQILAPENSDLADFYDELYQNPELPDVIRNHIIDKVFPGEIQMLSGEIFPYVPNESVDEIPLGESYEIGGVTYISFPGILLAEKEELEFYRKLDYNLFLKLVQAGKIEGKDLIKLCNSSKKFQDFCNRDLVLPNGDVITQYLFRELLKRKGIHLLPWQNPREIYKERTLGGKVWAFGSNDYWQMGISDTSNKLVPILISDKNGIIDVSYNWQHALMLDNKGKVWVTGGKFHVYFMGIGKRRLPIPSIIQIPNLANIVGINAGQDFSIVFDEEGKVFTFGINGQGQLGFGDYLPKYVPTMVPFWDVKIVQVSTGVNYTLALDDQGRVWSWGYNHDGQLGLGNNQYIKDVPFLVPYLKDIVQISAGGAHSLTLDSKGKVRSFGWNEAGQLGLGDYDERHVPILLPTLDNIVQISAGGAHSLALDGKGKVWCFGSNETGQLGLNDDIHKDETVPLIIPMKVKIIQVSAGTQHSLMLDDENNVWSFGDNVHGQLGLGDHTTRYLPVKIPNLNNVIKITAGAFSSFVIRKH